MQQHAHAVDGSRPACTGCHPTCFAQHCLRVDHAPTGRAKCKADGAEIAKGAVRLLIGYKKESTIFKLENAHRTIVPKLVAVGSVTMSRLRLIVKLMPKPFWLRPSNSVIAS